jgi:hypothetical protein
LSNTNLSFNRAFHIARAAPEFPSQESFGIKTKNQAHGPEIRTVIASYFTVRYNNLDRLPRNQYNIQHSWTSIRGRHEITWGADIVREQGLLDADFESVGRFDFNAAFSGNNMVDFLYGKPAKFTQITQTYLNAVRNLYGAYVQDNIRVNRRFTLNLGLRWNPGFSSRTPRNLSQFSQEAYAAGIHSTCYPNLAQSARGRRSRSAQIGRGCQVLVIRPTGGVRPRPLGNGRTSIRGAMGVFTIKPLVYLQRVGPVSSGFTGLKSHLHSYDDPISAGWIPFRSRRRSRPPLTFEVTLIVLFDPDWVTRASTSGTLR